MHYKDGWNAPSFSHIRTWLKDFPYPIQYKLCNLQHRPLDTNRGHACIRWYSLENSRQMNPFLSKKLCLFHFENETPVNCLFFAQWK